MSHPLALAFCLLALLIPSQALGAPMIVQDGKPAAAILVTADALVLGEPPAKGQPPARSQALHAAEELQHFIEKISGAKLPILAEDAPLPEGIGTTLLVGHTAAAKNAGIAIPSGFDPAVREDAFEEEGYVLRTIGNSLVIAGNEDGPYQGTLYATYALLEEFGCRWYFPGAWGEVIPARKDIALPQLEITRRPDFAVRRIGLSGWIPTSREERTLYGIWEARVGYTGRHRFYPNVGDGFLAYVVPPNTYFEEHPEWYAMNQAGQRVAGKHRTLGYYENTTMLCLTNEAMYQQAVANIKSVFAGERKMTHIALDGLGISPPDGAPVCYCPDCQALSANFQYPQYIHRPATSEAFFAFAARLAREFPDKYISTMAYALREFPPQGVDLPSNIMVMYAPIANDVLHPHTSKLWRHAEYDSMLRQYRRQTPHITIYDYNPGFLTGHFVPERDAENMAINMPWYKEIDIKGFTREGRKAFMQTWISYYIGAKLMWDASADVDAIKEDFYRTFFGSEAGPHVRAWWDACAEALVAAEIQAHEDWVINHIYDLAFVNSLQPHVDAALAAGGTPEQQSRLKAFALIADHLLAFAEMNAAEEKLDYAAASAYAQRMTDNKQALHEISTFLIELDKITPPRKPRPYFAEGRKVKFDELLARTNGTAGTLVAPLPLEMKFTRDRFNEGVVMEWYAPEHDDADWGTMNTNYLWDQQMPFEDDKGHDYDGYGWYRGTFDVDKSFEGKPLRFWCGGISNEGWIWINGKYVGHKKHALWWSHPHDIEVDITDVVKPGQTNTIAIRVLSDSELSGIYRRGFFFSPKE